jgi:hypothetical protein
MQGSINPLTIRCGDFLRMPVQAARTGHWRRRIASDRRHGLIAAGAETGGWRSAGINSDPRCDSRRAGSSAGVKYFSDTAAVWRHYPMHQHGESAFSGLADLRWV